MAWILIAGSNSRPTTKGPIPPDARDASGHLIAERVPDFVPVYDRDGVNIAGYVPKRYVLDAKLGREDWPVVSDDLTTLVGHMVAGRGFVRLGVSPSDVPTFPMEALPSP
jgi:hypothetical protein